MRVVARAYAWFLLIAATLTLPSLLHGYISQLDAILIGSTVLNVVGAIAVLVATKEAG